MGTGYCDNMRCNGECVVCGVDLDPYGLCEVIGRYWRVASAVLLLIGLILLTCGLVLYGEDYAPFHKLDGFQITRIWVGDPRPGCLYNGKYFDCYDGQVLGNWTMGNVPHFCQMTIVTDFQRSDTQTELSRQFPSVGRYDMWSLRPDLDGNCVRSVNNHETLINAGISLIVSALVPVILALIHYCWVHFKRSRHSRAQLGTLGARNQVVFSRPPIFTVRV